MTFESHIDVQAGVDEKLSGIKLEEETADMFEGISCVFTVVPDSLIALEATEHTAFNLIFVAEDSQCGLTIQGLISSLRMVGSTIPIVVLKNANGGSEEYAAHVPMCNAGDGNAEMISKLDDGLNCSALLKKPFTKRDLCDVIRTTLFPECHRVGGGAGEHSSMTTDEDYRLEEDEMSN